MRPNQRDFYLPLLLVTEVSSSHCQTAHYKSFCMGVRADIVEGPGQWALQLTMLLTSSVSGWPVNGAKIIMNLSLPSQVEPRMRRNHWHRPYVAWPYKHIHSVVVRKRIPKISLPLFFEKKKTRFINTCGKIRHEMHDRDTCDTALHSSWFKLWEFKLSLHEPLASVLQLYSFINVQRSTMSPVLPFDITAIIIDIVGENNDTDLLKELALVSHSFHQDCNKHLFATVELHDAANYGRRSSKKGFIKLVKSRPNVVKYIRKLMYTSSHNNVDDHLLSPIFSNFLPTTSRLNCLAINASYWNVLDSSLISAFLHLMSLPTINHIDLTNIYNFPLSALTRSVNLHRLGMFGRSSIDQSEIVVESEMPKIRELRASNLYWADFKVFQAKIQDVRPAFIFMDLRRLWTYLLDFEDEKNIRYLLQNAKLLEKLHLEFGFRQSLLHVL